MSLGESKGNGILKTPIGMIRKTTEFVVSLSGLFLIRYDCKFSVAVSQSEQGAATELWWLCFRHSCSGLLFVDEDETVREAHCTIVLMLFGIVMGIIAADMPLQE